MNNNENKPYMTKDENDVDLVELILLIWAGKRIVLFSILISILACLFWLQNQEKFYRSSIQFKPLSIMEAESLYLVSDLEGNLHTQMAYISILLKSSINNIKDYDFQKTAIGTSYPVQIKRPTGDSDLYEVKVSAKSPSGLKENLDTLVTSAANTAFQDYVKKKRELYLENINLMDQEINTPLFINAESMVKSQIQRQRLMLNLRNNGLSRLNSDELAITLIESASEPLLDAGPNWISKLFLSILVGLVIGVFIVLFKLTFRDFMSRKKQYEQN